MSAIHHVPVHYNREAPKGSLTALGSLLRSVHITELKLTSDECVTGGTCSSYRVSPLIKKDIRIFARVSLED